MNKVIVFSRFKSLLLLLFVISSCGVNFVESFGMNSLGMDSPYMDPPNSGNELSSLHNDGDISAGQGSLLNSIKSKGIYNGCYIVPSNCLKSDAVVYEGILMKATNFIYKSLYFLGVVRCIEFERCYDVGKRSNTKTTLSNFFAQDNVVANSIQGLLQCFCFRFLPMKTWYSFLNNYLCFCIANVPYANYYIGADIGVLFDFGMTLNFLPEKGRVEFFLWRFMFLRELLELNLHKILTIALISTETNCNSVLTKGTYKGLNNKEYNNDITTKFISLQFLALNIKIFEYCYLSISLLDMFDLISNLFSDGKENK